jgi:hypothetical protein
MNVTILIILTIVEVTLFVILVMNNLKDEEI